MDLKTWIKGLGVFVASSFITSLAAMQLDPANFNFSRAGLAKAGTLALIIGIKAVLLYLKQSPIPESQSKIVNWNKVGRVVLLGALLPGSIALSGCVSSWEQSTYATLATGKALIDCAIAGYNHSDADIRQACAAPGDAAFDPAKFYIPQTRQAQQAIETARQAQIACVEAFEGYAVAKVGKDKNVSLASKQAAVTAYLSQLPQLLNAVRSLMGVSPPNKAADLKSTRDPIPALAGLRPKTTKLQPRRAESGSVVLRSPDLPITTSPDFEEVLHGR